MMHELQRVAGLVAAAVVGVACSGNAGTEPDVGSLDVTDVEVSGEHRVCIPLAEFEYGDIANAPATDAPFPWERPNPVVLDGFDFSRVISGGPPPDGIQPIDEPCFDTVAAANDWLEPQSPVMVLEVGDDRRAYPLAILTQHEITNDVVGGIPVVVTYCPLCNSALAFERTVDGQVLDFGTSGRLYQSNLVMYDRQTRSLWTQFTGEAVVGADFVGTVLERLPTSLLSWAEFVAAAPDGVVLSPETFPDRDYGRNPYVAYEGQGDQFLFEGPRDERLPPNSRVVGLGAEVDPVAVALDHLRGHRVVEVEVGGDLVTVLWSPGQSSALDTRVIDNGKDVGSTGAFRPVLVDGTRLTFTIHPEEPNRFRDQQTGSTWNLLGRATAGELSGTQLEPVARDDTFWFVWFAFQPETAIVGADAT